jgi:hypothetical protein
MRHSTLKLGKLPASLSKPVKLKFRDFLDRTALPPLPKGDFGHDSLVTNWGMLGNDKYGDCIAPDTKVLTADLQWVTAGSLQVGDKLLGFDEEHRGGNAGRRFTECEVEKANIVERPCYELTFEDGTSVICSDGHRWLVSSTVQGQLGCQRWERTEDMRVGPWRQTKVIKPLTVWETDRSWAGGYLAAAFDGEGNLEYSNAEYGQTFTRVNFNQTDNEMLYQVELALKELGFDVTNYRHQRGLTMLPRKDGSPRKDMTRISVGTRADFLRFMGSVRPHRLLAKMRGNYGRIPGDKVALVSKVFIGNHPVVMLDTSSRTYFANGLASHNCVFAGAGHEHMLWLREAGHTEAEVTSLFTEKAALKNYSAVTGFNPDDPDTDQGTDMAQAASYRRKTGYVDSKGNRHKIGAYVDLDPGNITELWYAAWLFDGVGIGVNFPSQWMDAFNKGPKGLWDHVSRPKIEGGHYITGVGRHGNLNIVTWADDHPRLTPRGYAQFNDQTIAYASAEKLISGKDDNGFDWPGLLAALKEIDGQP